MREETDRQLRTGFKDPRPPTDNTRTLGGLFRIAADHFIFLGAYVSLPLIVISILFSTKFIITALPTVAVVAVGCACYVLGLLLDSKFVPTVVL